MSQARRRTFFEAFNLTLSWKIMLLIRKALNNTKDYFGSDQDQIRIKPKCIYWKNSPDSAKVKIYGILQSFFKSISLWSWNKYSVSINVFETRLVSSLSVRFVFKMTAIKLYLKRFFLKFSKYNSHANC